MMGLLFPVLGTLDHSFDNQPRVRRSGSSRTGPILVQMQYKLLVLHGYHSGWFHSSSSSSSSSSRFFFQI